MEKKSLVEVLTLFESVLCVYEEFLGVFQKYILLSLHKHLPFRAVILSQNWLFWHMQYKASRTMCQNGT